MPFQKGAENQMITQTLEMQLHKTGVQSLILPVCSFPLPPHLQQLDLALLLGCSVEDVPCWWPAE